MAPVQIRTATPEDLPRLAQVDHGYSTDYVWQMDLRDESASGQVQVTFRPVRLPRPMRVNTPHEPQRLLQANTTPGSLLVAEREGGLQGYLSLTRAPVPDTAWVADYVVERRFRRTGVGSVLLAAAGQWARQNGFQRLVLEMQSKNYPAISFAQKHGLAFCGYNDRYYPNQDVALFFGMILK